ncbi:hypothetical protein X777_09863 [Ooceraea biroi]|uniref:Uncharacterized protein n=1 Tax=Ooceraea biroi TaxID=2015173 RepID=A0A026W5T9_OOCBI|nr:hypothetical protein X777_09863 [Ooceraea biroi]
MSAGPGGRITRWKDRPSNKNSPSIPFPTRYPSPTPCHFNSHFFSRFFDSAFLALSRSRYFNHPVPPSHVTVPWTG